MDKTNELNDLNIDQENEETLLEETEVLEQTEDESSVDNNDELLKLRSENKKLVEIIKRKNEREAKNASSSPQTQKPINTNSETNIPSRDEIFLVAQGFTEEDIDQLHLVAKGTGLSLKEAKEHPLFTAYADKVKAERRAKKASLGTSRGSASKPVVKLEGMSAEDHKKYWREKMGME